MKNIFKLTFVALAFVLSFVSCDNIDLDGFEPNVTSGWVEFEEATGRAFHTAGTLNIPMEYNVPVNQVNTTVTYTVEVIEGSAPGAETGTFVTTVPRNTRDLSIDYEIDPSITSNYTLLFTITETSNPDVIIGLEGDNPDTFTLEVCYNVIPLEWTGNAFIDNGPDPVNDFTMTLTPTDTEGEYTISSAWGTNFVAGATGNPAFDGLFIYDGTLTLNPDNSVSIVGFDTNFFPGTVANADSFDGNEFDPCNNTLTYTLEQGLFTAPFLVNVRLTPVN